MTTFKNYTDTSNIVISPFGNDYAAITPKIECARNWPYCPPNSYAPSVEVIEPTDNHPRHTSDFTNSSAKELALTRTLKVEKVNYFAVDEALNQVYLSPKSFDVGFIVEETPLSFTIWNAWINREVQITDIQVEGGSGLTLESLDLPLTLNRYWSRSISMSVDLSGNASQDSLIKITIDSINYYIEVKGIRIIPFKFDHDWKEDFIITYNYETAIFTTSRFHEQRRSLSSKCFRDVEINVEGAREKQGRIFNITRYGKDKIFGVPIYSEPMYPTDLAVNEYIASLENSTFNMYNLNELSEYVIILDTSAYKAEIKKIYAISDTEIEFINPISTLFNLPATVIYPCMIATLSQSRIDSITDQLVATKISFGEYS